MQEVSSYFSPTTTTESKPGSCKFLSNSALKKYKLNFKDRVAQIILLVDCCLQSYFLRTAKYLALRTTKMATAADTTSWTSTNKHWIAFSQFLRSETKHIIRGYMDIGLSGQLINVTLNPYNYFSDYNAILVSFCHNLFMITFTLNLDYVVWSFSKCDEINFIQSEPTKKTLPKAQRTRGLSSAYQSNLNF